MTCIPVDIKMSWPVAERILTEGYITENVFRNAEMFVLVVSGGFDL